MLDLNRFNAEPGDFDKAVQNLIDRLVSRIQRCNYDELIEVGKLFFGKFDGDIKIIEKELNS